MGALSRRWALPSVILSFSSFNGRLPFAAIMNRLKAPLRSKAFVAAGAETALGIDATGRVARAPFVSLQRGPLK